MKTVTTKELQEKMSEYLDKIEQTGEALIVTRDSIPTLKIIPLRKNVKFKTFFRM